MSFALIAKIIGFVPMLFKAIYAFRAFSNANKKINMKALKRKIEEEQKMSEAQQNAHNSVDPNKPVATGADLFGQLRD